MGRFIEEQLAFPKGWPIFPRENFFHRPAAEKARIQEEGPIEVFLHTRQIVMDDQDRFALLFCFLQNRHDRFFCREIDSGKRLVE